MLPSSTPTCSTPPVTRALKTSRWIIRYILPAGWLALLTGLFWVGDRSLYHKLYYGLLAVPALTALICQPKQLNQFLRHPLVISYIFFAGYVCLSVLWSTSEAQPQSLIKRPLYVLVLMLSAALLASDRPNLLPKVFRIAGVIAVISASLSYVFFLYAGHGGFGQRFSGYGALYNPLLSAHIFGFFAAFWLSSWFIARQPWAPAPLLCLAILGVVILSTGSRTPLLALSATAMWLCVASGRRRGWLAISIGAVIAVALLYLYPTAIMSRGLSYRPDIWVEAWRTANERLLFGHGYDHQLILDIRGTGLAFNDPHNIELAVLLAGGLVGLALWITLYAIALTYSWRNRGNPSVLIASSLLVFGLAAGLTEGRDFISRPKEHWFLIWIPFSLLLYVWIQSSSKPLSVNKPAD